MVEVKSDGVDMWSCPIKPNNWALYLKRDGNFDGNRSGICVTEDEWKKYNVGDQYP